MKTTNVFIVQKLSYHLVIQLSSTFGYYQFISMCSIFKKNYINEVHIFDQFFLTIYSCFLDTTSLFQYHKLIFNVQSICAAQDDNLRGRMNWIFFKIFLQT